MLKVFPNRFLKINKSLKEIHKETLYKGISNEGISNIFKIFQDCSYQFELKLTQHKVVNPK